MDRRNFNRTAAAALSSAAIGGLVRGTGPARSEATSGAQVRAVLELFTSQGCSSCPAADALFETFANRRDVVALTLPVDYWDYLGWKDTLANAKFTKRQRYYAKQRGDGQIYTPQLVFNGAAHTNGADAKSIEALLGKSLEAQRAWVPLKVDIDNGHVVVDVAKSETPVDPKAEATVWVASVSKRVDVPVKRGENAGKTLSYFNVVRDVHSVGTWTGNAMAVRVAREALAQRGEDCCAVLLQVGMAGPILGAAMLPRL